MTAEAPATTDIVETAREVPLNFLNPRQGTPFGDLGTKDGLLGGINAVIVGNYLSTLGRDPTEDLSLLEDLQMPIKALNDTL